MKNANIFLALLLLLAAGCGGNIQTGDDFITVDVTKSYPQKELILQDFMDVEYIALETGGEFYTQGVVMAVGKEIMVVKNRVDDGNIYIFDKNGKGLRKINRKGRGPEEYSFILKIVLDEDNSEIFVSDHHIQKIIVYDLYGKFKRSINNKEEAEYDEIYNYDRDNLICKDGSYRATTENVQSFAIISKQDGTIIKEIQIPFEQKKSTIVMQINDQSAIATDIRHFPIIPYGDSWILMEPSSDTIFIFSSDDKLTPLMTRTPPVQSMNPEIFLFPEMLSDRYYFMKTVKKEYDFTTDKGFPDTHLLYDRQEKKIYECSVYNADFSTRKMVEITQKPINNEIAFWQRLEADELVEAYEKGQLKGKLKEVASKLKEEDNPVIMLVKHRK